jgi:hypothetical protein
MPKIVIRLQVEDLREAEEVKFWGELPDGNNFILVGEKFDFRELYSGRDLGLGTPSIKTELLKEKRQLTLFIGHSDSLQKISTTKCKYYPFNEQENVIIESEGYSFLFPGKPDGLTEFFKKGALLQLGKTIEKTEVSPPTCNGKPIELFNTNGVIL